VHVEIRKDLAGLDRLLVVQL
jgi:hypothetical protein